jgi:hypothetical protein
VRARLPSHHPHRSCLRCDRRHRLCPKHPQRQCRQPRSRGRLFPRAVQQRALRRRHALPRGRCQARGICCCTRTAARSAQQAALTIRDESVLLTTRPTFHAGITPAADKAADLATTPPRGRECAARSGATNSKTTGDHLVTDR